MSSRLQASILTGLGSKHDIHTCALTCFYILMSADMNIAQATKLRVDWKTGVAATDWSVVAKKEHLDQLGVELRKLEDSIREVYTDMLALQQREQEMRDISGE